MNSPIVRFVVTAVEEKGGLQYVSGRSLAGEYLPKVLAIQQHGAASHPPIGSIGLAMPMGDNRDQMLCIGLEAPGKRPIGLGAGHAVIYDADGNQIYVGNSKITLTTTDVEVHGNLKVIGGSVTHNGVNIGSSHVHGGVTTGGADTATPH